MTTPRKLSREDVLVNNLARRYGIDVRERATMTALREAYRAGLAEAGDDAPLILKRNDRPNG